MRHFWIFLFLLMTIIHGFAQQKIGGKIGSWSGKKVYLLSMYGERLNRIDSTMTDSTGSFSFVLLSFRLPGMYRITWGKDGTLDLIWNRENIRFTTDAESPVDSLTILQSDENRMYHWYSQLDRKTQAKLELLVPVVDYYPEKDQFWSNAVTEMETIQRNQSHILDSLDQRYPGSYTVRIFKLYKTPFVSPTLSPQDRIAYLKLHYFDKVDFTDTALLRSNAFPNKAISYLALYWNSRLTQKQLEAEFIKAVTLMLSAASVNAGVFKFLLDYLVSGFDKYHFEEVITYIADNFQDPFACEDQAKKTALQKKLDTFKKIAIGQPAPDFEIPDSKGKIVKLSAISSEYTLLIFWSSECPHCTEMMPKVKTLYDAQKPKRFEILSVSLDTSRTEWQNFLKDEKLNWINSSELKGFNSTSTDLYNIYATPTMFLLDREKKIIAKPISYRELEGVLRENGLL